MFANVEKAPRRWLQFRGPSSSMLSKALQHNVAELHRAKARVGAEHDPFYAMLSAGAYSQTVLPFVEELHGRARAPGLKSVLAEFLTPNLKAMGGKKLSAAPQLGAGPRRLSLGLLDGSPHRRSARQGGGLAVPASMEDAIEEV